VHLTFIVALDAGLPISSEKGNAIEIQGGGPLLKSVDSGITVNTLKKAFMKLNVNKTAALNCKSDRLWCGNTLNERISAFYFLDDLNNLCYRYYDIVSNKIICFLIVFFV